MARRARAWIAVVIVVVAAVAAFSVASDLRSLGDRLAGFAWHVVPLVLLLTLANYLVRGLRWHMYLRAQGITVAWRTSALVFVAGFSMAITPGKLGELIKSVLLRDLADVPVARSAPVVIAERVSDLVGLVLLSLAGALWYGTARGAALASTGIIVFGLIVIAWPRLGRASIDLVTRPSVTRRLRGRLHEVYDGLAALCRPRRLTAATGLAVIAWLAECVGFAMIIDAFPGASVPLGVAVMVYATTVVIGALSFLPGGLGVTESAMTLMLVQGAAGLDAPTALAATVLIRLFTLWFGVALGLGALAWARRQAHART